MSSVSNKGAHINNPLPSSPAAQTVSQVDRASTTTTTSNSQPTQLPQWPAWVSTSLAPGARSSPHRTRGHPAAFMAPARAACHPQQVLWPRCHRAAAPWPASAWYAACRQHSWPRHHQPAASTAWPPAALMASPCRRLQPAASSAAAVWLVSAHTRPAASILMLGAWTTQQPSWSRRHQPAASTARLRLNVRPAAPLSSS